MCSVIVSLLLYPWCPEMLEGVFTRSPRRRGDIIVEEEERRRRKREERRRRRRELRDKILDSEIKDEETSLGDNVDAAEIEANSLSTEIKEEAQSLVSVAGVKETELDAKIKEGVNLDPKIIEESSDSVGNNDVKEECEGEERTLSLDPKTKEDEERKEEDLLVDDADTKKEDGPRFRDIGGTKVLIF